MAGESGSKGGGFNMITAVIGLVVGMMMGGENAMLGGIIGFMAGGFGPSLLGKLMGGGDDQGGGIWDKVKGMLGIGQSKQPEQTVNQSSPSQDQGFDFNGLNPGPGGSKPQQQKGR